MLNHVASAAGQRLPFDPKLRGLYVVYRPDGVNHCPGCGRAHWIIGRFSAECAFCATALPLIDTGMLGSGMFRRGRRSAANFAVPEASTGIVGAFSKSLVDRFRWPGKMVAQRG